MTSYRAESGYGFFTQVQDTKWKNPDTHARRDKIWSLLPESTRNALGSPEYFFEDDFGHDTLREMLEQCFPEIDIVWCGDSYSTKPDPYAFFVGVKSTLVSIDDEGDPVDLSEHGFISAAARAQIEEVSTLFGDNQAPRWFTWMTVN
jgi:hypothetical protein